MRRRQGGVPKRGYRFSMYDGFPSTGGTEGLARDLSAFVAEMPFMRTRYKTFVAVFDDTSCDERDFERRLWAQLQALHDVDRGAFGWSDAVSSDPRDPAFGFSVAAHPFFIVGLHPAASRTSRRFALPALVFNSHEQFAELKRSGHFRRIQSLVRAREFTVQGSLNPNLAEHGTRTEARQYSGRATEEHWTCPFHRNS